VLGVKPGKQALVRQFLNSRWGSLRFAETADDLQKIATQSGRLVVWASRDTADLRAQAAQWNLPVWRLDDGMLCSSASGRPHTPTMSLALDRSGVPSAGNGSSDLEQLLCHASFDEQTLSEAAQFRQRLVAQSVNR